MSLHVPTDPDLARGSSWSRRASRLRANPTSTIALVLVALLLVYFVRQPSAASRVGLLNLSDEYTALALAAVGETFVVVMGGIDMSVGAVMALVNVILTVRLGRAGDAGGQLALVALTVSVATACGVANGLLVSLLRLPSIIVTLATMFVWTGAALLILPQPGGSVPEGFVEGLTGSLPGGVPVALLILVALAAVCWYWARTPLGMAMFASGGSELAARVAGLPVRRLKLLAFAASGLCYGLAGVFLTAQTGSGDPNVGSTFLLEAFAAVAIGGTAFGGGRGSFLASVLGALVLGVITNVLLSLGVSSFATSAFYGLLLFVTVAAASRRVRAGLGLLVRGSPWRAPA
jgi:ribose transport system permease protein